MSKDLEERVCPEGKQAREGRFMGGRYFGG